MKTAIERLSGDRELPAAIFKDLASRFATDEFHALDQALFSYGAFDGSMF
ncbi:MAG TPA: hypothetical protein VGG72_12550 [Bryobacteraceae bacterium]